MVFSLVWNCKNRFYYPTCKLKNIGAPLKKFVFFFLFIFFVEHLYFPISSFFTTYCKIITSHKKDVFVSEIIFKIKKSDFHLYFLFSLGRDVLRISLKISQGTKEGAKIKVMFSLSVWVSLWSCKVWLFYTVADNVRPILIQNTNGNLHW